MSSKLAQRAPDRPKKFGPSMTKPGQSLHPSELLKRHLAGTLPDIEHTPQFTFDQHGNQIGEDLSHLELHELHDLARTLRTEYDKRASELKSENEKNYRQQVIDDYKKEHAKAEADKSRLKPKTTKTQEPKLPEPPAI